MKNIKIFTFLFGCTLLFQGCYFDFDDDGFGCLRGNGNIVTERIFVPEFHSINLSTSGNVFITQGNEQRVEVELDENLLDDLRRTVRNGKWDIEFDRCINRINRFDIFITIPDIRSITISGSGEVFGENDFVGDDLDLTISGSGNMDISFTGNTIDSKISGSGNMRLEGEIDRLDHEVPGSGDLFAFSLFTDIAKITTRGSGDSEVNVSDLLIVRITGSGDVFFKGDPETDISISGSGDVVKID
jgi:hypothetical protein